MTEPPMTETERCRADTIKDVVVHGTGRGRFRPGGRLEVASAWIADEPTDVGGLDRRTRPCELLLASAGSGASHGDDAGVVCRAKALAVEGARRSGCVTRVSMPKTALNARRRQECVDRIDRVITLEGDLTAEQRSRLMEIPDQRPGAPDFEMPRSNIPDRSRKRRARGVRHQSGKAVNRALAKSGGPEAR